MGISKYTSVKIEGNEADLTEIDQLPISFDYELEDGKNFKSKSGSKSLSIGFPATTNNQGIFNDFTNVERQDNTPGEVLSKLRAVVIANNGQELLVGKLQMRRGGHTNKPTKYVADCFGQNSDWALDLKEKTLHDFVNPLLHYFDDGTSGLAGGGNNIQQSWLYDGMDEDYDYVYAPVLFHNKPDENYANINANYLTPSISPYWIIYRAFKSIGYKIKSDFLNSPLFRQQVMPFTWSDFTRFDNEEVEQLLFRAVQNGSLTDTHNNDGPLSPTLNLPILDNIGKGFDNGGVYSYNAAVPDRYRFTYNPPPVIGNNPNIPNIGVATFKFYYSAEIMYEVVGPGATINLHFNVFKNGSTLIQSTHLLNAKLNDTSFGNFETFTASVEVKLEPGEFVEIQLDYSCNTPGSGQTSDITIRKTQIWNDEVFRGMGSIINFKKITAFRNHKFLDMFAGFVDDFNLQFQTDNIAKEVLIEPYFDYSLDNNPLNTNTGYINGKILDWTDKQDLSVEQFVELKNEYERLLKFKAKEDAQDGMAKILKERHATDLGSALYQLPNRYKTGTKDNTNRFFSQLVHYRMVGMGNATNGIPIQIPILIQENISNTSKTTANKQFLPKLAYYKGLVNDAGSWYFNGQLNQSYPYMFAVNYNPGGEHDPILSYTDERIDNGSGGFVIGRGLLKRFFLQRLAIMRNGQSYEPALFRLENIDFTNWYHREFIQLGGSKYILRKINGYRPLVNESTRCELDKWHPIQQQDLDNSFPSPDSVGSGNLLVNTPDIPYTRLLVLSSDIPNY